MPEPATVVGLVVTALQLVEAIKGTVKYTLEVRDAPRELMHLSNELQTLHDLLEHLTRLFDSENTQDSFRESSTLFHAAGDFVIELESFQLMLERFQTGEKGFRQTLCLLKWPLKQWQTQKRLQMLQRYTGIFQLSIQVEGFEMLQQNYKSLETLQQTNGERSSALRDEIMAQFSTIPQRMNTESSEALYNFQKILKKKSTDEQYERDRKVALSELPSLDFRARQEENYLKRHKDTYSDFLKDARFNTWFTGTKCSMLWCPGNPGAGKTVLASVVIDHALNTTPEINAAVVYAYCDFKEPTMHNTAALLAALTRQLLEQDPHRECIFQLKNPQGQMRPRHRALTKQDIMSVFSESAKCFERVYVIIDALDELPELVRDDFVEQLSGLQSQIHLLVTSRYNIDPRTEFDNANRFDIIASVSDVRSYMKQEICKCSRLRGFITQDPLLGDKILEGVGKMSKGIFLLAHLQIQSLGKQNNIDGVYTALEKSPAMVLDQYNEAMERIRHQDNPADTELALKLLSLVHAATRPLTTEEVCYALAIKPGESNFKKTARPDIRIALSVSVGLVKIVASNMTSTSDGESTIETVRLVHYTLEEYFEENGLFPTLQLDLTRTCLTYLSYEDIENHLVDNQLESSLKAKLPFLDYAVLNWGFHAHTVQLQLIDQISIFLRRHFSPRKNSIFWRMLSARRKRFADDAAPEQTSPLIVATVLDLKHVLNDLLRLCHVDSPDGYGFTALHFAAHYGDLEMVQVLLNARANVNARNKHGETPLSYAELNGHHDVAKLLMERGAENDRKKNGSNQPFDQLASAEDASDDVGRGPAARLPRVSSF